MSLVRIRRTLIVASIAFIADAASAASLRPVAAENGMVVTAQHLATRVGVDVLRDGGNAVDAAVAVGYALAVVYPAAGNLGGGGFMTIQLADGRKTFLDFREKAPLAATANTTCTSTPRATSSRARARPGISRSACRARSRGWSTRSRSTTYTLNDWFGAKVTAASTGVLLNDEMDDFTAKIGVPDIYGLVQGQANAIAPGKRPLSSMSPTIVARTARR